MELLPATVGPVLRLLILGVVIASNNMIFAWAGLTIGRAARRHWEGRAMIGSGTLLILLATAIGLDWL